MFQLTKAYTWEGITRSGKRTSGTQIGDQLDAVRAQLQRQGILVTQLRRTFRLVLARHRITPKDIAHFSCQLAYLLRAGFGLLSALDCLAQQYPAASLMQSLLIGLRSALENGMPLSAAFRQYPYYFSTLYCHLIVVGEQCGNLVDQLLQLSDYQEKLLAIKRNIYKALYYPIGLLGISSIVLILLILWVVPQFEQLFSTVGATLPSLTRSLINSVRWLQSYGWIVIFSGIGLSGLPILFRAKLEQWIMPWEGLSLQLPWIGSMMQQAMLARFAYTLSTTLTAGLPMLEALAATQEVMNYSIYRTAISKAKQAMMTGMSLDQALIITERFPPLLIQMIAIGQLSGHLDKNLAQFANLLETQFRESVANMISFLEPTLLLILGVFIGVIMLALYWPIFELGNVVGLV